MNNNIYQTLKPAISATKASMRKLFAFIRHAKNTNCLRLINEMKISKKKYAGDIVKSLANAIHINSRELRVKLDPADLYINEASAGKFLAFRKIRRYAKGRASFGKSYISKFKLSLDYEKHRKK